MTQEGGKRFVRILQLNVCPNKAQSFDEGSMSKEADLKVRRVSCCATFPQVGTTRMGD